MHALSGWIGVWIHKINERRAGGFRMGVRANQYGVLGGSGGILTGMIPTY
jgi:hypothetical protein